jgi:hypothetical protein
MIISFQNLPNTGTREVGSAVRLKLIEVIRQGQGVTIDLANKSRITPSFADELFGKLAADIGIERFRSLVQIVNVHPSVVPLIHATVARRIGQSEPLTA